MSEVNIHAMKAEEVAQYLGVDAQLASLLVEHAPYTMPEDVLRAPGLMENATLSETQRMLDLVADSVGRSLPQPVKTEAVDHPESGMVYGVKSYGKDVRRVFIASPLEFEILSVELDEEGEVDLHTLRILTRLPHEFASLGNETLSGIMRLTGNPLYTNAGLLAPHYGLSDLPKPVLMGVSVLADLAVSAATINACGPDGLPVSVNPDRFGQCCFAHDICYGRGGTEEDRLRCDSALYDCIKARTGPLDPRARIFYWLVLAFGRFAFDYRGGGAPVDMDVVATTTTPPTGGGCRWDARLLSIAYTTRGENAGPVTLDITRDLEQQMRENPNHIRRNRFPRGMVEYGSTRTMNPPDGYPLFWGDTSCGDTVLLPVFFGDTGRGSGQNVSLRFICNGFTYEKTVEIRIEDAVFDFHVQITTQCSEAGGTSGESGQ